MEDELNQTIRSRIHFFCPMEHVKIYMQRMDLIDNKPYISIPYAAELCDLEESVLRGWLFDPKLYSVHFIKLRRRNALYADVESVLLIVKTMAPHKTFETLRRAITRNGNARRTLTSAQKQQVAAEQEYKCAACRSILTGGYEVDHIEEWAVRANDARCNLEALCCPCHRKKTRETQRRGDALFEDVIPLKYNEDGTMMFSQYFFNQDSS